MKNLLLCISGIVVSTLILCSILIFTKDYWISNEETFVPYVGAVDIYHASKEELTAMNKCNYSVMFGEVENAEEASAIAEKVIEEVYQKDESPYVVKYNEIANAWIVSGSLSWLRLGGVASVAIDKNTGEILMIMHTK